MEGAELCKLCFPPESECKPSGGFEDGYEVIG
jgi:hypothetical protein